MQIIKPVLAYDEQCILGEGPVWDAARKRLLWVDIRRGLVITGAINEDDSVMGLERIEFNQTVGAVAVSDTGDMLVAGAEELLVRSKGGHLHTGPRILPKGCGRRLNDGKVDPQGRFVVGSLSLSGESDSEVLARVDQDGHVEVLDEDLTLSNGIAWSASGERMYSVDTLRRTVYVRTWNGDGKPGQREEFLRLNEGYPDGMCLDAEEHLWVAMWGLGEVRRYSPGAALVQTIHVPAPHVSSVAFAGPTLQTLVITTATQDLTGEELERYPLSGCLFTARPGVSGLPQQPWQGFTTTNK